MSTVTATFNYFVPPVDGSKPVTYITEELAAKHNAPARNWVSTPHELSVINLRGKEDTVTLDGTGFQYLKHDSALKDFSDDATIEKIYYPESAELLKKLTGASRVQIFDHTIRRRRPGQVDNGPSKRQPVPLVHVDQTNQSAANRVKRHLPSEDVPDLLNKRYQIINLWRPINHAAEDFPLALADYKTVNPETDLIPGTLHFEAYTGETFSVKFNEKHQWYYVKGMGTDEAVLIKCFDTLQDGTVAVLTPHSAFNDPSTAKDAPLRESIELRALVFYD